MSLHEKHTKMPNKPVLDDPRISLDSELMSYVHDVAVILWENKEYQKGIKKLLHCCHIEKPRPSDAYIIMDAIQLLNQVYRNVEEKDETS